MDEQFDNHEKTQDIETVDEISTVADIDPKPVATGVTDLTRRGLLGRIGVASAAAAVGMNIPFGENLKNGWVPAALAEDVEGMSGKNGLKVLNDRPLDAETFAHLLDDAAGPRRCLARQGGEHRQLL